MRCLPQGGREVRKGVGAYGCVAVSAFPVFFYLFGLGSQVYPFVCPEYPTYNCDAVFKVYKKSMRSSIRSD